MAAPILFVGGTGIVGRRAVQWLRKRNASIPILIGGRNMSLANDIAREIGGDAKAVAIDLTKVTLGLEEDTKISAVVMLAPDHCLYAQRFAQNEGFPFISITTGLTEIAAEVALFAHTSAISDRNDDKRTGSPIVLASHWGGGAATILAVDSAKQFDKVETIRIRVVLDDKDPAGPSALEDMERVLESAPAALAFVKGHRSWLQKDKGPIKSIDGRLLQGDAFGTMDTVSLYALTAAPNIRFDIVTAESSQRARGGEPGAETIVEIEGEIKGEKKQSRTTLEFKHGQASQTALSTVLILERLLERKNVHQTKLYMPETVVESSWFLDQIKTSGGIITNGMQPTQ